MQLASEISATYPSVKRVYIGQGATITLDSLSLTPCLVFKVQTDTMMNETTLSQLKKWVQVRLQVENVEIANECINQF